MTPERYERYLDHIKPEQAHAIGSWVLAITYMRRVSHYITDNENLTIGINPINASTKIFLSTIRDEEFRAVRESLATIQPDSNAHIARWRMGVAGKTRHRMGNKFFTANKDFILATFYHEDANARAKIDAGADVTNAIEADSDQFIDFYVDRVQRALGAGIQETSLPELIHDAQKDMEYWLSEPSA